jgi:putative membrane protein
MMGFGFIGILFMLLFGVAIVAAIAWVARVLPERNLGESNISPIGGQAAREILDQRFARGEISREDYEVMKGDLSTQ